MTELQPGALFDVNALVALSLTNHLHHRAAHAFLVGLTAWSTTPVTESGLYRLLLNPAVVGSQRTFWEVDAVVQGFRADPRWSFLPDDTTLAEPVVQSHVLVGHRQVTDLHLVNLARRHGVTLATFDRGLPGWLSPKDRGSVSLIPVV